MKNLLKSLSDFQKECPVIHKGTQGYGYSYADLPAIFEIINPLLAKHGLGFTQPICGTKVKTILFHVETGETLESETDIPQGVVLAKMNEFQVLGSAITYIRRYSLSSMLGIITDKDNDAAGEQIKPPTPQQKPQQAALPRLVIGSKEFYTSVNYLKNGHTKNDGTHKDVSMDDLKKKFTIGTEVEEALKSETLKI